MGSSQDEQRRPVLLPSNSGRSGTPLLQSHQYHRHPSGIDDEERGRSAYDSAAVESALTTSRDVSPFVAVNPVPSMPNFSRRSTLRSTSPDQLARQAVRQRYTYAAFFLFFSLVSFTVQTQLSSFIQQDLGWNKSYCMLYLTHSSWAVLWPFQLLILRSNKPDMPWDVFWRRHVQLVRTTALMVETRDLDAPRRAHLRQHSPIPYMLRMTAFVTTALTVAGLSWYIAVDMTTPSDLTAIYNCSAFFAYAFSIPLLREPVRLGKTAAVAVAIAGVLVVAYGDGDTSSDADIAAKHRFFGNIIIGIGSVLYGLYEVLYKRYACPPDGVSPERGMIFANTFGSCIGLFTMLVLWIPLPILHWTGIETFVFPTGQVGFLVSFSVLANVCFSGAFLILISLTSPVFSSVAALLTIFTVAVTDWLISGRVLGLAALGGGFMIILAFGLLSWSTYREMAEKETGKGLSDVIGSDGESSDDNLD